MPQFNMLNVRDTAGAGVRDKQQSEWNALRQEVEQTQFDDDQRMQNTQWLAGAARYGMDNPQAISALVTEGKRRGIIDPNLDARGVTPESLLSVYHGAMAAAGGGQPAERQILKDAQGLNRYVDSGEQVFPDATAPGPKQTTGLQEYQFAKSQGFTGTFEDWKAKTKGGITVDARTNPTPAAGFTNVYDDNGQLLRQEAIPGGPADLKAQADAEAAAGKEASKQRSGDLLLDEISRSFERIGPNAGGFLPATGGGGAMVRGLSPVLGANTKAQQLEQIVTTLKANIGFDRLQEMRNNSPTGGALGQVSEMENRLLQATAGNLDPNQPDWMFAYNLSRLHNKYMDVVHGKGEGGDRWAAPEAAYRKLYENAADPQFAIDFKGRFGYLPPGFE